MTSEIEPYQEERPWGMFRKFTENQPCTVKIIKVKAGESLSLQSHEHRSEFWHIIAGEGMLEIGDQIHQAKEGDEYTVPAGTKHRITASAKSASEKSASVESGPRLNLSILEIALGEFSEEDIKRFDDKYGRSTNV